MFKTRLYRVSKGAGRRSEDAFACNREIGRFALSDGASTSYASRAWARALCWQFMRDPDFGPDWLQAARVRFSDSVTITDDDWSATMAFDRGSFATFLGFTILPDCIQGYAIGDSILFIIDQHGSPHWFPALGPEDFARDPVLLSTRVGLGSFVETEDEFINHRIEFTLEAGTTFRAKAIATTDALAAWAIGNGDKANLIANLTTLTEIASNSGFHDFVQCERAAGSLRIDDCTLMIIEL
jgi:hypothetical protein